MTSAKEVFLYQNVDSSVERSNPGGTPRKSSVAEKFVLDPLKAKREPSAGRGQEQPEGLPLVINTNLASTWDELQWARLRIAQGLLLRSEREREVSRRPKGSKVKVTKIRKQCESRTAGCFWKAVAFSVEHWKVTRADRVGAYVRSVLICGSRSACPRCSMKIWLVDRDEIQLALVAVERLGWMVKHATFTVRHKRKHELKMTLANLRVASREMRSGRKWQEFKSRYGVEGSITITENTFSLDNGHHPHTHEGIVINRKVIGAEHDSMRDELAELWLESLAKVGLDADYEIGVVMKDGTDYFAEYVSKWGHEPRIEKRGGLAYELTGWQNKTSGANYGHYTMLQLLDLAGLGEVWAGNAWLEFVEAFEGRAMIRWSSGLRAKIGLPAKTESDKQKANRLDDGEKKLFALYHHKKHWLKVRGELPKLLDVSTGMEFEQYKQYLNERGMDAEYPLPESVEWNEEGKL